MSLCVRQRFGSVGALLITALLLIAAAPSRAAPAAEYGHANEVESTSRITEGDRLHTRWNHRLVVEVGPNRLKLDERTTLFVRRLDRDGVVLDLERGSVVLDLRRPESAWRWQVDTAAGRHQPHGAGLFRIDAPDRHRGPDSDSGSATAWRSALRIENEDGTLLLPPGQRAERDRQGRWQLGYPQADAFAAWAMGPMDRFPPEPDDREPREDWRPRHWRAAPSWEVQPTPLPPPSRPPRVIVMPPPIGVEPPPRHWHPRPDIAAPPRPDRRHHEAAPVMPSAPSAPAMPRQDEPRRPQRAL